MDNIYCYDRTGECYRGMVGAALPSLGVRVLLNERDLRHALPATGHFLLVYHLGDGSVSDANRLYGLLNRRPPPDVIAVGGRLPLAQVIDLVRQGLGDYRPDVRDIKGLIGSIRRIIGMKALKWSVTGDSSPMDGLIGSSPAVGEIRRLMPAYARSEANILITGETGTGKGLVARILHELSPRREAPYLSRNCGAIPETLVESEFLGTENGAFTGAVDRPGCLERASGGTLFLDEIGELSSVSQATLLHGLEEPRIVRVGGTREREAGARILAATNRDLLLEIREGRFRQDLYYRLRTLGIHLPPLRDRPEDIPLLVRHFLDRQGGRKAIALPAMERLLRHDWPGNIRELRNVLSRALVHAGSRPQVETTDIDFFV